MPTLHDLREGDRVQTHDQTAFGTVVQIDGKRALVDWGACRHWAQIYRLVYAPDQETIRAQCAEFRGQFSDVDLD